MIDFGSGMPIVRQVTDLLRERVRAGVWKPGERLPAEADLAHELRIGKDTLRDALALLRAEGVLRGGGRGQRAMVPPVMRKQVHRLAPGESMTWRQPTPAERAEHDIPEGVPVVVLRGPGGIRLLPGDRWQVRSPWPTDRPDKPSNHD